MFNLIVKPTSEQKLFLARVRAAMEDYFGDDQKRIEHALQVCRYAEELLTFIDADPVLTLTSAYLHDIGIHEAERKHGSTAGNWQELEGPAIAVEILAELDADLALITLVAEIVGKHHTERAVDSPEFRILWDADALVNFADVLPSRSAEQVESILHKHMVTEPGLRMARQLFSNNYPDHQ